VTIRYRIFKTSDTSVAASDFSPATSVKVYCLGPGGNGSAGTGTRRGGGGGAFAIKNSLAISGTVSMQIGAGGSDTDTWFKSTSDVLAKAGITGLLSSGGTGGAAASCVGDTKYSGGDAGLGGSSSYKGGGGGAAGPSGAGKNGGTAANNASGGGGGSNGGSSTAGQDGQSGGIGGNGGAASDGTAGGTGTGSGNGGDGSNGSGGGGTDNIHGGNGGTQVLFTDNSGGPYNGQTVGVGGGGGGSGISSGNGGNGGPGAGGGGARSTAGAGGAGWIVVEWDDSGGSTSLPINDAAHAHSAEQASLTGHSPLGVNDAAHAHAAEQVTLSAGGVLTPNSASHGHVADQVSLTGHSGLPINDAAHAHTADVVPLSYPGMAATTFATSPSAQYHPNSQSATLDGSNRVTACPDIQGLAALTGDGTNSPVEMTDALGRKFWRFSGAQWLAIDTALSLTKRDVTALAIARNHRASTNCAIIGANSESTPLLEVTTASSRMPVARVFNRTHTTIDANYNKLVVGSQLALIGISSRAGSAGTDAGVMLLMNGQDYTVGQVGTNATQAGGYLGRASGGGYGEFDIYEIAIWDGALNDSATRAARDAMLANWTIEEVDRQIVLMGDSITRGVTGVDGGYCSSMILSAPDIVPPTCRVVNCASGGQTLNDAISERNGAASFTNLTLSGGVANNVVAIHMGTNDMATIGGSEDAATVYGDMVSLLYSASPSGYLQKGWKVYVAQNIAASDAYKMTQIPTLRALYNGSQFLADTDSGYGGTYEGLVRVIQTHLITRSPDGTIFFDTSDANDATYYEDVVHLNEVGTETLITGGDTRQYGYVSIFADQPLLLASGGVHAHAADQVSLSGAGALAINGATHGHTVDQVTLAGHTGLAIADSAHGHTADQVGVSAGGTIAGADATHAHMAEQAGLTGHSSLGINDAGHAHAAETVVLTGHYALTIADALHGHAAEQIVLTDHLQVVVVPRLTAIPPRAAMPGRPVQHHYRRPPNI